MRTRALAARVKHAQAPDTGPNALKSRTVIPETHTRDDYISLEVRTMAQPEKRFKVGACTASIFVNEVGTGNDKIPDIIDS